MDNVDTNQDNLVGLHQLARELRLPVTWLKQQSDRGQLPCLRVGKRRLFNLAAVRKVLAERAAQFQEPAAE